MAKMSDVPVVLRKVGPWQFAKRVWQQVGEDNIFTWGAALAYSWMFALFPFLIFLLSLVPLIVPLMPGQDKESVRRDVDQIIDKALTGDAADVVRRQVQGVLERSSVGGLFTFGLLLTIYASSGGMSMTMSALDKAYDIEKVRPYYKQRFVAICLTMVVAVLFILVMVLLPVSTTVLGWLSRQGMLLFWLKFTINIARYAFALALMLGIVALIYHFGPSFRQKFHAVTPGAVFSVVVWILLGVLFRIYLTKLGGAASYNKTYGAVAGAAILLLFFYIDALVLLIGAEINSEIDFAVLGIPSGGGYDYRPAEHAEHDSEQQALAQELVARRVGREAKPQSSTSGNGKPA